MTNEIWLEFPCPGIGCNNKEIYTWVHSGCGGFQKLNTNLIIKCVKCGSSEKINNWRFNCGAHSGFEEGKYLCCDFASVCDSLSIIGKLLKDKVDKNFILRLLGNMAEAIEDD